MNFILEETKRKEIIEQIDKSIFVEAGAGAGKTTIIINRIMNQIRQGIKPQHIVVITFTNAASSELYDRIEKRLEEEERISQNAQEQRYFQNALENLNQMTISTIHSFCYKLLMERAFEAKMPIGFTILENEQTLERQQKFIEQWIGTLKKEQILEMQQAIKMVFENSNYKRWVKTAFETICEKPEHIHIVSMEDVKLQEMKQKLDTVCQNVEILKQSLEQELLNFIEAVIKFINGSKSQEHFYSNIEELFDKTILYADYINLFKKVKQGISEKELKEIQKLYEKYDKKELKIYKKDKNVNVKALEWLQEKTDDGTGKHLYIKWRDCIEFLKEYGQKYAYFVIMKYALQARDAYKDSLNGISVSNDELLQRAKDFICNSSEARAYFANKYHYIYVDEFQDTDHVQAELIWKLVCDKTNKLRQGALFVVGDPKQSIYRFRGGEPEVYYEIKERMEKQEDTCIYQLNENYRSNEKIISWVNETFAPVISTEKLTYEDMECAISDKEDIFVEKEEVPQDIRLLEGVYEYRFSVPETENTENIEQVKQSEKKNKQTKEELVQEEAKEVAKMIYRLVNGDYGVYETKQVEDGTLKRSLRKITYKDFLVLSWKKTDMNIYLKEMHKLGIPVDFSGTILPKEDRIIQSFFHLYRYLITPFDRKVQVAASYLVSGDSKIGEESEERLQYLKQLTKGKNRYGKAQFLIEHIEYLIGKDKDITKEQIISIQAKLRQMIEWGFAKTNGNTEELVTYFKTYMDVPLERELSLTEQQDAVRFMNLHKAKGLEATITVIVNRKNNASFEKVSECKSNKKNENDTYDYYSIMKLENNWNLLMGCSTESDIYKNAEKENKAELIRLEYVAATRAKEVLIVMPILEENSPFSKYEILEELCCNDTIFSEKISEEKKQPNIYQAVNRSITQEMKYETYVNLSPSSLEGEVKSNQDIDIYPPKDNSYYIKKLLMNTLSLEEIQHRIAKSEKASNEMRRPKGNIFGITMHRSFELFVNKWISIEFKQEVQTLITASICQAIMENQKELLEEGKKHYLKENEKEELYLIAVKDYLEKILEKFSKNREIRELLLNAKAVYTELPFSYYTSREESPELFKQIDPYLDKKHIQIQEQQLVWVNGTVDLVIRLSSGGIKIIDYKSDIKNKDSMIEFEEHLKNKYKGQMILYKDAMKRLFCKSAEEIVVQLYHLY